MACSLTLVHIPGQSYLIGGRWLLVGVSAVAVAGPVRLRLM